MIRRQPMSNLPDPLFPYTTLCRAGYLVGPRQLVAQLDAVVLPYHLDAVKQAAGRIALQFEPEMRARVASLVEERGRVGAALAELPVDVWPSDRKSTRLNSSH